MYRIGIQKFPTSTFLKIQFGFFLLERLNKKNEAMQELNLAQKFNPTFDEQFIIYRYKKIIEDYGDHNMSEGQRGNLDIVSKYAYEASVRQCK